MIDLLIRNYGFRFHHAEGDVACMMLWLKVTPCVVPPYATHHCGVGAVIIDQNRRILVVKEHSKLVGWKLPGGYVNAGEELSDAAIREVFEETGVKTKFNEVMMIRHSHKVQFGMSDIYVICKLEALSSEICIDQEISDAKWMDVDEFYQQLSHPMTRAALDMIRKNISGWKEVTMPSIIPGRLPYRVYQPLI